MKTFLAILLLAGAAFGAGLNANTLTLRFAGVPSGPCNVFMLGVNNATNHEYNCGTDGLWHDIGAGGAGTVTSVGLAGTANQVTVTGATPITTSGSWTLSVPSTFIAPGTFEAVTSITSPLYLAKTNCSAAGSAANPSLVACTAAPIGQFSCDAAASTGTCKVSTTALAGATDIVFIQPNTGATISGVTCSTTADTGLLKPRLLSQASGFFIINLGTFSGSLCFNYSVGR